jgi:transcriptional regulator with XRE-family HTH domain
MMSTRENEPLPKRELMAHHGHKARLGNDPAAHEVFAVRLKQVREWHRLSQAALSRKLEEAGHTIHPSRVKKLETGRARPTVEDLLALALVLDVSPLFLVVPPLGGQPEPPLGGRLRVGKESLQAPDARAWWRGEKPLPGQLPAAFAAQQPDDEIPLEYRDAVKAYRPPKEEKKR